VESVISANKPPAGKKTKTSKRKEEVKIVIKKEEILPEEEVKVEKVIGKRKSRANRESSNSE
jgi:hypothetical protein